MSYSENFENFLSRSKKITELTPVEELSASDYLVVVSGGVTKKTTVAQLTGVITKNLSAIDAFLSSLSGNNESIFSILQSLSGNWQNTFTTVLENSGNWDSVYTTVLENSGKWDYQGTDLKALSANWQSTFTTVQSNSATKWDNTLANQYTHANFLPLSGGTITGNVSATGSYYGDGSNLTGIVAGDTAATTLVRSNSGNWDSVYTTVQSNSAVNWNYQGTDLKALSANWQNTFTTVQSNSGKWDYQGTDLKELSANWQEAYDISSAYRAISSTFLTSETDSQILTFNEITKNLSISNGNTVSLSTFAENSFINSITGVFTPLTLTSVLTSNLLDYIKLLAPVPTYTPPTASISNFSPSTFEIGENVNRTLTLNWNQNNAGTRGTWRLNKNGTEIISGSTPFPATHVVNETAVLNTTTYQLSVNFDTGTVINNSLGFPDNRGQILAGSVINSSSYVGYYRRWIGSTSTFPSNIRTSGLTTTLDTNNTLASPSSPIYINNKFILIVIPNTKTLTSAITEANENLTVQFSLSNIQIPDAGSILRSYKLYYLETAVPLNANLTTVNIS